MQQGYEKENITMSDKECREKILELVENIDNFWVLRQVYRFIVNMTK